jgi:hypothetical protein
VGASLYADLSSVGYECHLDTPTSFIAPASQKVWLKQRGAIAGIYLTRGGPRCFSLRPVASVFATSQKSGLLLDKGPVKEAAVKALLRPVNFSSLLMNAAAAQPTVFDPRCILDKTDKFDQGPVMTGGVDAGRCIDTRAKRPAVVTGETARTIEFANFYHEGHFWKAKLDKKAIRDAIFQIEEFPTDLPFVRAAHTQLRFVVGRPLRLRAQYRVSRRPRPVRTDSFIVSSEYMAPEGVPFDLAASVGGNFAIATRVASFETRSAEEFAGGHTVRQHKLRLDPSQKAALARAAIHASDRRGYGGTYDMFDSNCTTELFDLLDSTLRYRRPIRPFEVDIRHALDPVHGPSIEALSERDLISPGSEMATANRELGSPRGRLAARNGR